MNKQEREEMKTKVLNFLEQQEEAVSTQIITTAIYGDKPSPSQIVAMHVRLQNMEAKGLIGCFNMGKFMYWQV